MANKGPYYEKGTYKFRVTDQGFAETEKNHTPYFFLRGTPTAIIDQGIEYAAGNAYEREIVLYLSEKAVEYTVEALRKLGWEGSSFKELDPATVGAVTWIGQDVTAVCDHETNDKGTWERWNLPFDGKSDKPPKPKSDPKIASKLDVMFGAKIKGTATKKPAESKPARETVKAGDGSGASGDVPF